MSETARRPSDDRGLRTEPGSRMPGLVAPGTSPPAELGEPGPNWSEEGLSSGEVTARIDRGAINRVSAATSQSWAQILRRNAFTRLNFLLVALGTATLATGSAPDATFLAIALINTVVGTVQETRAKRTLDALAVINAPHARVVRDGQLAEILPDQVVLDDLLDLRPGDQLTADAIVVSDAADVDESLATGESEPVSKTVGDSLISGSWVIAGALRARVTAVGTDSYANRLASQARRYSLASSELMRGINQVLRWLSWAMVIIAPILFLRQLQTQPWRLAVRLAVAGLVGMIPEGLVLLTTLAFLAAALRLARRHVLVQELPSVETLARVDALCVDKTGTLTEGGLSLGALRVAGISRSEAESALASLGNVPGANSTISAIKAALPSSTTWPSIREVPFSSARKWSAASFAGHGTWVLGAPDIINAADPFHLGSLAAELADHGARVLALAKGSSELRDAALPSDLALVAVVELHERVRAEVTETLSYFDDEGVTVRVISGDNPATARSVAERVGLSGAERVMDARNLPTDPTQLAEAVEATRVFGRVTPDQKQAMVGALQSRGHAVAMTGDGVNDVLALKDADLGVAMGSGSTISRGVAQVVILDNNFDTLPSVVGEGRRVLANIELVAVLFLVKNVYSLVISTTVSITGWPYPFLPRHLTLISAVAIGIPGFFIALGPNDRRFLPGFLRRVLSLSILAGTITAVAVLLTYAAAREEGHSGDTSRTAAVIVAVIVSLWVLWMVARPHTALRVLLVLAMAGLFVGAYLIPGVNTFFSLQHHPGPGATLQAIIFGVVAGALINLISRWRRVGV